MSELKYKVELDLRELQLLAMDNVNEPVRDVIRRATEADANRIRYDVSEREGLFLEDIRAAAESQKSLYARPCRVNRCPLCGNGPHIINYKSGRQKGKEKSRIGRPGYEFKESFIRIEGTPSLGCCAECFQRLTPIMAKHIEGMECEVDEKITGHPNRFTRYQNRKCSKCGWFGHEGQMGRRRTMFGDGYYPAQCPSCNAVNEAFGLAVIAIEPGYTAVPVIKKEQSQ